MKQIVKHSLVAAAAMVLVACGGGGGDAGTTKYPTTSGSGTGGVVPGTTVVQTATDIAFVSTLPELPLVVNSSQANGRQSTATLTFKVTNQSGGVVSGEKVLFTLVPSGLVTLNVASATTGADGTVTTSVTSGNTPTSVTIKAVLERNPAVAATSNRVAITSGDPVQSRFVVVTEKFNLDGRLVGDSTKVTVYASDENGIAVADGLPVTFTSDLGQVSSTQPDQTQGVCLTENGRCSVVFNVSAPFIGANGSIATVIGSTTLNGGAVLSDTVQINFAGAAGALRVSSSSSTFVPLSSVVVGSSCTANVTGYVMDSAIHGAPYESVVSVDQLPTGLTATVGGTPTLDSFAPSFAPNQVSLAFDLTGLTGVPCVTSGSTGTGTVNAQVLVTTRNGITYSQNVSISYPR